MADCLFAALTQNRTPSYVQLMTKARTVSTPRTAPATDPERMAEAKSWVTKQLRFEHFLGSLERRIAVQLDEVASNRHP